MLNNMINNLFGLLTLTPDVVVPDESGELVSSAIDMPAGQPGIVTALLVVLAAICVGLIVIILMQKKRASGIGAALSGTGETYWSKNKGKSVEGSLEKYTKIGGTALLLIALIINIIIQ